MRAAVLRNAGDTRLEVVDDLKMLDPGPDEVVVRVMATGVCHSDLSVINQTMPHPTPAILGHEGAGIVTAVGRDARRVHPGDHVIIAWSAPCGHCVNCVARHRPQLCGAMYRNGGIPPRFRLGGTPVHSDERGGHLQRERDDPGGRGDRDRR